MMCDLNNKEIRKEILGRYLDAETTIAEERALVEYFMQNNPDDEERAVAAMIVAENNISRVGFDENSTRVSVNKNSRARYWLAGAAAAIAVAVTCFVWICGDNAVDADVEKTTIASNVENPHVTDTKDSIPQTVQSTNMKVKGIEDDERMPKCESRQLPKKPHRLVDDILAVLDVDDDALVSCDIAMKGDGALVTKVFSKGEKRTYLLTFGKDGEYDLIALNQ